MSVPSKVIEIPDFDFWVMEIENEYTGPTFTLFYKDKVIGDLPFFPPQHEADQFIELIKKVYGHEKES